MGKKTWIKRGKHRRAVRSKLFRRDYIARDGKWSDNVSPFHDPQGVRWIRCYYCGEYVKVAQSQIAHIVAHCRGGSEDLDNLVLTHGGCNNEEGMRYNQVPTTLDKGGKNRGS